MNKSISIFVLLYLLFFQSLLASSTVSSSTTLVLEGHYQGKNVFVQNGFASDGVGYCVTEVTVNGNVTTDEINALSFEIDLTAYQFKIGEAVIIKIKHKKGCRPKILNPTIINPRSTFEIEKIGVSKNGLLSWSTIKESGKLTFYVQQFRWNKWVKVGEVDGKGASASNHDYHFRVTPHSGENKFRVSQTGNSGKTRYSQGVNLLSTIPEVSFKYDKETKKIIFSDKTMFEVYDVIGSIKKKGFAKKINLNNLKKGAYYLNFDNKSVSFVIKD